MTTAVVNETTKYQKWVEYICIDVPY